MKSLFAGLAVVVLFGAGCLELRSKATTSDDNRAIESLDGLPGTPCDEVTMVLVGSIDGSLRFCIDRFEAGIDSGALGNAHQGVDDSDTSLDGTTLAKATVGLAATPATAVSWYQAKAACLNAGKRLCTQAEWELACGSHNSAPYPYGDTYNDTACNGFFNYNGDNPAPTGSFATCGSAFGVYDMSGNVEEWLDTAAESIRGSGTFNHRLFRGGSFRGNRRSLGCVGEEFHDAPGGGAEDRGFRCCK